MEGFEEIEKIQQMVNILKDIIDILLVSNVITLFAFFTKR